MNRDFTNGQAIRTERGTLPLESEGVTMVLPQMVLLSALMLLSVLNFSIWIDNLPLLYLQVALILGPLLRFSYFNHRNEALEVQVDMWHVFPYVLLVGVSFVGWFFGSSNDFNSSIQSSMPVSFYVLTICLLTGYVMWILLRARSIRFSEPSSEVNIMLIVTIAFVVLTPIVFLKMIEVFFVGLRDSYTIGRTIYIVVFMVAFKLIWILFGFLRASVYEEDHSIEAGISSVHKTSTSSPYTVASIENADTDPELIQLASEVEAVLFDSDWIVNPTLSLDSMEDKTGIAKSRLSHLLNTYYNKGFYQIIGEYRIRYAMKVLEENKNISFEALSERCGFNSKTTFYKYFKKVNGCTPNAYLRSLESNGVTIEN